MALMKLYQDIFVPPGAKVVKPRRQSWQIFLYKSFTILSLAYMYRVASHILHGPRAEIQRARRPSPLNNYSTATICRPVSIGEKSPSTR